MAEIEEVLTSDWVNIYIIDELDPKKKHLVYKINTKKEIIYFYPTYPDYFVKKIIVEWFKKLPDGFSDNWYILSWIQAQFNKIFWHLDVNIFRISKDKKNSITSIKGGKTNITINYDDFIKLRKKLNFIKWEQKRETSRNSLDFFNELFPKHISKPKIDLAKIRKKRVIENLDKDIIKELEPSDVKEILNFVELLLNTKYSSKVHKYELFKETKLKVDNVTLDEIIDEYTKNLKWSLSESDWGKFIKRNLFLISSEYIEDSIPELNTVLAGSRPVDFWLITSDLFLDIFEIKKPTTKLLWNTIDRWNYYFHSDIVKAITQAEKYLFNVTSKRADLERDIKREKWYEINVTKPKAILLIWHSSQLDNPNKKEDFRILRQSYKNIEILLYDELLDRLKNLKNKFS